MAKRLPIELKPLPPPRLEIMNLIDVLITLIAFFMMTSVFIENNRQFGVNLPEAGQAKAARVQPSARLVLEVTKDAAIYWNGNRMSRAELQTLFQSQPPGAVLVIKADRDCRYQTVITLLDQAKAAELTKIALEARTVE
jgi:biopolymer transport protein ExbD